MEFPPALIHLDPDRKSCIVKCLCFIVCLVCFVVWGVPTLCGGCQLRLANVEPSRLEVRWGTCASLTSLGLYVIQRVICLRLARILFFFFLRRSTKSRVFFVLATMGFCRRSTYKEAHINNTGNPSFPFLSCKSLILPS